MKALVIGGNRFFGKRLVSLLIEGGHEVSVLNRGNLKNDFGSKARHIALDRTLLKKDHPALEHRSWDVVYDQVCFSASDAEGACETFHNRVGHYVFVSSKSVYSMGAGLLEAAFNPWEHRFESVADPRKEYAEAKRQCEAVFAQKASFPVTSLRIPMVLGTDDYTERLKWHVDRIVEQKPFFLPNLHARMGFVNSQDVARFLYFLRDHKYGKPINCGSRQPIAMQDLIQQIETTVGKKSVFLKQESETDHSPFGIPTDWFMDTTAMENLGFQAKPLQDWLPDLIRHYGKNR